MSWSSLVRRPALALALLVPVVLAGCSGLRPIYGAGGGAERIELAYASPDTRLDQIIQQDLALRLGLTEDPDAPMFSVETSVGSRTLTRTGTVKPVTQMEAVVVATYRVAAGDEIVIEGTRRASASYATSGQVLADEAAFKDAVERAGHEVAETIRLTLLAELSQPLRAASLEE